MRPLTLAVPKPFFPLGVLPLVEFAFQEARAAGMEAAALVVSPSMVEPARRYLEGRDPSWIPVEILVQEEPRGLADAILRGLPWLGGEGAAVLNPDSLFTSAEPPLASMVEAAGGRGKRERGGSCPSGRSFPRSGGRPSPGFRSAGNAGEGISFLRNSWRR